MAEIPDATVLLGRSYTYRCNTCGARWTVNITDVVPVPNAPRRTTAEELFAKLHELIDKPHRAQECPEADVERVLE